MIPNFYPALQFRLLECIKIQRSDHGVLSNSTTGDDGTRAILVSRDLDSRRFPEDGKKQLVKRNDPSRRNTRVESSRSRTYHLRSTSGGRATGRLVGTVSRMISRSSLIERSLVARGNPGGTPSEVSIQQRRARERERMIV